jgi:amidohydrolase
MLGTIRSFNEKDENMIIDRVRTIVTKTAEASGATGTLVIPYTYQYPVVFNDSSLTVKMLPSLLKATGANKVEIIPAVTIAEDFSFYQRKAPGLFFNLGGMTKGADKKLAPSHHTPDFYINESSMKTGIKAFLYLVTDYMKKGF